MAIPLHTYLSTNVGALKRACGWPRCTARPPKRVLVEIPGAEEDERGVFPRYCSTTCRVAAQKRRRTLRTALTRIDAALADPHLARSKTKGPQVFTKAELRQWRSRIEWELEVLC